jgi:virginiamycin B lyase
MTHPPTPRPRGWPASLLAAPLAVLVLLCVAAPAHAYIYWDNTGNGTIARANLNGTGVNHRFITRAGAAPSNVAVDGAHIYWTREGNNPGTPGPIGRANLDGTNVDQSFITEATGGVAVDGTHIYWTNGYTVGRANLDGTGANQRFITGAANPLGVAVDGAHIYWTNQGNGTIGRANLDGTEVNQSFITRASSPTGVAVDGAHIYWSNQGKGTIGRANLGGTNVDQSFITRADGPFGVAVDALGPAAVSPSLTGPIVIAAGCGKPLLSPGSLCAGQIGSKARDYVPEFSALVGSHNPDHDSAGLNLLKKMGNGYQSHGWGVNLHPGQVRINRSKVSIEVKHPIGPGGADGELDFTFSGGRLHTRSTCGSKFHVSYGTITGTIQIKVRDRFFKTITITRMRAQAADSPVDTCNPSPTPCSPPGYSLGGATPPQGSAYNGEVSVTASKPPSSGLSPLGVVVNEPTAGTPFTVIDADMVLGGTKSFLRLGPNLTSAELSTPGSVISGGLSVQASGVDTTFPEACKIGHDQITNQPAYVTTGKVTATFDSIGKVSIGTNSTFSLESIKRVP